MAGRLDTVKVISLIAIRNLFASRLKTIIVGGIIFFGALLVVVGTSLLDSIDGSISRSITGSVAGHVQVYSNKSKDELTVMGGFDIEGADLAPLDDFSKVREALMKLPNVKDVVPMGVNGALVTSGNTIDIALAKLRDSVRSRGKGDAGPEVQAAYDAQKAHVQQMVKVLAGDLENVAKLQDESALAPEDADAVRKAARDDFWAGFDKDPLEGLEFLENRIAPLATDADMLFLRYVGTDPELFSRSFDRLKIVDGGMIPRGKRGFLFSKYTYEDQLKLKTARRLDKMKQAIDDRGLKIAHDEELKRFVRENTTQVREIVLQLDARETEVFRKKLQAELGSAEPDVAKLLSTFFDTTDETFARRYDFFYKQLAPALDLYRVRVGDTLTIKAFTRSGYVQSVNLRVYGTFDFKGLEGSPQAGELSLMDLVSFRELYGFLTDDRKGEIAALKKTAGAKEIARENAEAELFGSKPVEEEPAGKTVEATATPGLDADKALEGLAGRLQREDLVDRAYDPKQLGQGVVLNAAVILKDPDRIPQSIAAIEEAGRAVGLPLKAISWQAASGIIGQFATMARLVLFTAVLIIFVVALVIINNAMVMATLERVREIGTLRAVGAQRRFVLGMLLIEALVVGLVFGLVGVGVGTIVVTAIGKVGIPAVNDVAMFFFSGPRLYPSLGTSSLGVALIIVLLVSVLSSFYPAWLAMKVTPRQAMASED